MAKSVAIMCLDTNVLVLSVHHFPTIGLRKMYFQTGRKGKHIDRTRYIPVRKICQKFTLEQANILLPVYCITGCETCCRLYGIGKKINFKLLMKDSGSFQSMKTLSGSQILSTNRKKQQFILLVQCMYVQTVNL